MAQSEISYTNKIEDGGVTAEGIVAAADLNDIKNTVNANADDAESRFTDLEVQPSTTVTTATYNANVDDRALLIDDTTAAGIVTVNLPSAATAGDGWTISIKKIGTDFNVVIDPDGTETIDGKLTRLLSQTNDSFVIMSNGSNYFILSKDLNFGWANYVDSNHTELSPLNLNAGNGYTEKLTIDGLGAGSTESQWPFGVAKPWDTVTNKLIGTNNGDEYSFRLQYKAQDGASEVLLDTYIDIGDPINEISRISTSVAKGASVETNVLITSTYFTGSTFVLNGGDIYVSTDSSSTDMSIWDIKISISKNHTAI